MRWREKRRIKRRIGELDDQLIPNLQRITVRLKVMDITDRDWRNNPTPDNEKCLRRAIKNLEEANADSRAVMDEIKRLRDLL